MKRIFEDILDDIDLDNNDLDNNTVSRLIDDSSLVDSGHYSFILYVGFYLGSITQRNRIDTGDIKNVLKSKEKFYNNNCSDLFKKVEKYLDVYTDEYWTDNLMHTNACNVLLDDLTENVLISAIIRNNALMNFFYTNKVYYINFDNNYHHFFKFLYIYSNYFYPYQQNKTFPLDMTICCIPYKEMKDHENINNIFAAIDVDLPDYKNFFIKSFTFTVKKESEKNDPDKFRISIKDYLKSDAENIYRYFYQDFKILNVLDKFETEEERLDFIEEQIWKLKLKEFKK